MFSVCKKQEWESPPQVQENLFRRPWSKFAPIIDGNMRLTQKIFSCILIPQNVTLTSPNVTGFSQKHNISTWKDSGQSPL